MPKRIPLNRENGARVTLRLTVDQEAELKKLDRKVRRQFVPRLRNHVDHILQKLQKQN